MTTKQLPLIGMMTTDREPASLRVTPHLASDMATGWLPGVRQITITSYADGCWELLAECDGRLYGGRPMELDGDIYGYKTVGATSWGETLDEAMRRMRHKLLLRYMAVDVSPYTGAILTSKPWRREQPVLRPLEAAS